MYCTGDIFFPVSYFEIPAISVGVLIRFIGICILSRSLSLCVVCSCLLWTGCTDIASSLNPDSHVNGMRMIVAGAISVF